MYVKRNPLKLTRWVRAKIKNESTTEECKKKPQNQCRHDCQVLLTTQCNHPIVSAIHKNQRRSTMEEQEAH
ncbi:hypothetical protein CEXT_767671 [Caerostris extrusa]|uniref:Uncharacterized protein n=1 Tax=Caerostris extrusa TaxID=172846 RepID=A0AAV4UCS0_CAEEX|nr:hypothetical protein CEXT_767671 [Caerostris extrusa]